MTSGQDNNLRSFARPACRYFKYPLTAAQGYGGGDTAVGGGQTGGDQFSGDADRAVGQQQDTTYGGDQTNLDAGADTNYGVIPCLHTRNGLDALNCVY